MLKYLSFILLLFLSSAAYAEMLTGKVVYVSDGDTVTIKSGDAKAYQLRLSDIDAPEKDQPFGLESKAALLKEALNQQVTVEVVGKDHYGRTIGRLFIEDQDLNSYMVEQGNAWVYRKYSNDSSLLELEDLAKKNKHGLWKDSNPIPPWEWRHN